MNVKHKISSDGVTVERNNMEEENKVVETATEEVAAQTEEVKKEDKKETKQEKTFSRDELAKIMAAEKEKWQAELEAEKTQAEKLAKMNAEEKIAFERDQLKAELESLRAEKAKADMTKTARGMLSEASVNISEDLLATLVTEEAETTKNNVDSFIKSFKEEVDKAVKEALKGKVAKKPAAPAGLTKEAILSIKDRSERLRLIEENQGLFN